MRIFYTAILLLFVTCFTNVTTQAQCVSPFHNALSFDGNNDYLSVQPGVYFKGNLTIEAWFKPNDYGSWARILDFTNGAGNNEVFLASSFGYSGQPDFNVEGVHLIASKQLVLNQWNHVAATLKGNLATIYVNGEFAGSTWMPTPTNVVRTHTYIGQSAYLFNGDTYLNGTLDELRVWSVAKTQAQIQAGMNHELVGNEAKLVLYYDFNQGTAGGDNTAMTILNDQSHGLAASLNNYTLNGSSSNFINDNNVVATAAASLSPTATNSPICIKATTDIFANKSGGGLNPEVNWYTKPNGGGKLVGTGDMINQGPGYYYARFSSSCSFPVEAVVYVAENRTAISSTISTAPATCNGTATGTLDITPTNGAAPYMYNLGTGGVYPSSTGSYNNLKAGTYAATIQDANGCVGKVQGIVITQAAAITGNYTKTDASCYGTTTGSLTINPTTGTAPYTYRLGATGSYVVSNSFTSVKAGTYYAFIKDNNGCEGFIPTVILQRAAITGTYTATDVTGCRGNANGSLTVNPIVDPNTGGNPPYQYKLGVTGTYSPVNSFNGLTATAYRVYIQDADGCEGFVRVPVLQPAAVNAITTVTEASCVNATDGVIDVTGTGGTAPYTYRLGKTGAYGSTNSFTGLGAGTYYVYILDANGCSYSVIITVQNTFPGPCVPFAKTAKAVPATAENNTSALSVSLSPNPSNGVFKLTTHTANTEAIQLRAIDINGRVVYTAKGAPTQTFSFGEMLNRGVYLVEVRQGNEVKTVKAVKIK